MDREITLVFGKTGMGKTQWTRRYLRSLNRVLILDPQGEYDGPIFDDLESLINHVERYRVFRARTSWVGDFGVLCEIARAVGHVTLVIEEAQRIMPPSFPLPASFENIVYRGRLEGVSVVVVSQRPTTVHIVARSQWTRIITFAETEAADTRWLRSTTGYELPDLLQFGTGDYYEITPHDCRRKVLDGLVPGWYARNRIGSPATEKG